jgi:hypothetical protein
VPTNVGAEESHSVYLTVCVGTRSVSEYTQAGVTSAEWREAGITTPVLLPLSPGGNQMNGLKAVFAAFER